MYKINDMRLIELDYNSPEFQHVAKLSGWDFDYEITKIDKIVNDELVHNHNNV